MLWGWLPASMNCDVCGGIMELRSAPPDRYKTDTLLWHCLNKGYVKQDSHSKKKNYCKEKKTLGMELGCQNSKFQWLI